MSSVFFSPKRSPKLIGIAVLMVIACNFISLASQAQSDQVKSPPQGSITLKSDQQESNSKTGIITARGNVKINYPARKIQATAAQAQYFSRERRLILTGNVYVIQEGNSIRAETMTYLIDEGRFLAIPQGDRQVESTYVITEPQ